MCRSAVQHVVILPTGYSDIGIGEMIVAHNGISLGTANLSTTDNATATANSTATNTPVRAH
jgi:hypothetical protein